jgi:hypothetical protein
MKFKQFYITESALSKQKMEDLHLVYKGNGIYKDKQGNKYEWLSDGKRFKKIEENKKQDIKINNFKNIKVNNIPSNIKKYFLNYSDDVTNEFFLLRFEINKELRTQNLSYYRNDIHKLSKKLDDMKNSLELATTKYADIIKNPIIMYRGISGNFSKKLQNKENFVDKGFSYLSNTQDLANLYTNRKGVLLKVLLSKGQKGKIGLKDQGEFILPKNSIFKVINKNKNMITVKVI